MDLLKQVKENLKQFLPFILSFFYFLIAALYITYPLIFNLSSLVAEKVDELYVDWIINWNIHAFTANILEIFNANIFYPYHNTLAFSDPYITSSVIAFIPRLLIGEPASSYNFIFIFSLVTLGYSVYLLTYYICKNHFSSLVSGTLVAFSSYSLTKYMDIQLLNIAWVPLSILFFILFLDYKKYRYLFFSVFFFVAQMYNSFLPGYFIAFANFFILIFYLIDRKIKVSEFSLSKVVLITLASIIIVLPVIIPFYSVAHEFNYKRDIRDTIQFANRPEYTFFPGNTTRLGPVLLNTFYKNDTGPFKYDGFVGFMFFALTIFAVFYRIKNRQKQKKWFFFDLFIVIGIFAFVLSLGPAFQWGGHVIKKPFIIPLPYALFYYIIPGFNGLRNSSRWEMLFLLSFSVSTGVFLSYYFKGKKLVNIFLLTLIICLGILIEFKFPYSYYAVPTIDNFPKVYYFINILPKHSVISEFPIYNWGTYPLLNSESMREYYSTLGFWKTFNGYAGFNPPPWQEKAEFLIKNFPDNKSIDILKADGVNYIVLHLWEYDDLYKSKYNDGKLLTGKEIKIRLDNNPNLKIVYSKDMDYIYEIK